MTHEHDFENEKEHSECFCKSKWFKKFLLMFLSIYLGILCALCTFCAFHKPKMPPFAHHKVYQFYDKDFDFNEAEAMRKEMDRAHREYSKEFDKIRKEQDRQIDKMRKDINREFERKD